MAHTAKKGLWKTKKEQENLEASNVDVEDVETSGQLEAEINFYWNEERARMLKAFKDSLVLINMQRLGNQSLKLIEGKFGRHIKRSSPSKRRH